MKLENPKADYISEVKEAEQMGEYLFGLPRNLKEKKERIFKPGKRIIVLTGLSGAGKDTVVDELIRLDDSFARVKTCTTRGRRAGETEENDNYIRLTESQFAAKINNGLMLEFVEYAGNHYGTDSSVIDTIAASGKTPILRIDPVGAENVTKMWHKEEGIFAGVNLITIFVLPDSLDELQQRLIGRGDTPEQVERRMQQSLIDVAHSKNCQYILVNEKDKLNQVVTELRGLLPSM